jgi:hypothetical protein
MNFQKTTSFSSYLPSAAALRVAAAAAALGCAALGAQAQMQTVFNAYQDINGDFISPTADSYNCFTCTGGASNLREIGDIVTLGGTQRILDTATVLVGQFPVPGNLFSAYLADVTFSVYGVSNIGPTPTVTLLGSKTNTYNITANNSIYDLTFDFTGMNINMPNTIYYGVSVAANNGSPLIAGLRMGLFDYLAPGNYGNGLVNVPFGTLQTGIDIGTTVTGPNSISSVMYARTVANPSQVVQTQPGTIGGPSINTGYTGAVFITAVPEPQTYALMFLGVAAVVGFAAKRNRKA